MDMRHFSVEAIAARVKNCTDYQRYGQNDLDFTSNLKVVRYDFPDDELIGKASYQLTELDVSEIAQIGREVLPMLSAGFSPSGVAKLFQLALHLRDPSDGSLVVDMSQVPSHESDKLPSEDPGTQRVSGQPSEVLMATPKVELEATGYAYIAASTLRMFIKSEENYINSFNSIQQSFKRFYGVRLPVFLPTPTMAALNSLTAVLQSDSHAKVALYRILYSARPGVCEGLRNFLYEKHLENNGLHFIGIFTELCSRLKCSSELLMGAILRQRLFLNERAMSAVLKLISQSDRRRQRKMWRFGRLFDDAFLWPLQTRRCSNLVYTLAYALKTEDPVSNSGILNIAQFANVTADMRRKCEGSALTLLKKVQKYMNRKP